MKIMSLFTQPTCPYLPIYDPYYHFQDPER